MAWVAPVGKRPWRVRYRDANGEERSVGGFRSVTEATCQGVSRGTAAPLRVQTDHLVAAVHHVADERLDRIHAATDSIDPGPTAFAQVVSAIQNAMSGPPFVAALELWVSSRTDADLREALVPAERRLGKALREIFDRALGDQDSRQTRVTFDSLVVLLRGLVVTNVLRENKKATDDIVQYWLERMAPSEDARTTGAHS